MENTTHWNTPVKHPSTPNRLQILVVGDSQTGVTRFASGFNRGYNEDTSVRVEVLSTFGEVYLGDNCVKISILDGSTIPGDQFQKLMTQWKDLNDIEIIKFWDNCGEEFIYVNKLSHNFFHQLDIIFLVYSIDNPSSLLSVYNTWNLSLRKNFPSSIIYLVGNKRDLRPPSRRVFSRRYIRHAPCEVNYLAPSTSLFKDTHQSMVSDELKSSLSKDTQQSIVSDELKTSLSNNTQQSIVSDELKTSLSKDTQQSIVSDELKTSLFKDTQQSMVSDEWKFFVFRECICSRLPLESLLSLMQTCKILNSHITENLVQLFIESIKSCEFVPSLYGKYMSRIINADGWSECNSLCHPGYRSQASPEIKNDYRREVRKNADMGIRATGATSTPVPELDRIWVKAISLFFKVESIHTMKWD